MNKLANPQSSPSLSPVFAWVIGCDLVIKESLAQLHRVAPKDMELGGFFIPKGAKLWIPIHSLHVSNCNFLEVGQATSHRQLRPAELDAGRKAMA